MLTFKQHYPLAGTLLFIVLIVAAHIWAMDGYSAVRNTVSDLGAQGHPRRWIMHLGFLAFGVVLCAGVLAHGPSLRTLPILMYGVRVACTGIFCAAPFQGPGPVDRTEAYLHAVLAQCAGVAFCIGIVVQLWAAHQRALVSVHAGFLAGVILCSALFGLLPEYRGLAQRALYLVSLFWLVKYYQP